MAQGVASPGLLLDHRWQIRIDGLHAQQRSIRVVPRGIQARDVDPRNSGQPSQSFGSGSLPAALQGIDEGGQQQFAISQKHGIEERCKGFGVGGQHRPPAEHDRVGVASIDSPDRNALVPQQLRQNGSIQFPAEGQTEQIDVSMQRIRLVREQPAYVHIRTLGEGCPDDLVAEACDAHRIGAREGQHRLEGIAVRDCPLKQQRFLVQRSSPELDAGLGGAVNGRRCRSRRVCIRFSASSSMPI